MSSGPWCWLLFGTPFFEYSRIIYRWMQLWAKVNLWRRTAGLTFLLWWRITRLAERRSGGHHVGWNIHAFCGWYRTQRARGADRCQGIHRRDWGAWLRLDYGTLWHGTTVFLPYVGLVLHGLGAEDDTEVGALRWGDGRRFQWFQFLLFADLNIKYWVAQNGKRLVEKCVFRNLGWEKCLPGLFQETLPRSTACETRLEANSPRAGPLAQSRSLGKRPETSCG